MDNQMNQQPNSDFASSENQNGQNPNGQPPNYNANGYRGPYASHSANGGYAPQQGYCAYNPQQGYRPTYGGQTPPPSGYYYPQRPYAPSPYDEEKQREKKRLKICSTAHGLSVLGFSLFAVVLSMLMVNLIPHFANTYKHNDLFHTAIDAIFSLIVVFVPFFCSYIFLNKRHILGDLPLGKPYSSTAATLLVFMGLTACLAGSYVSGAFNTILETFFHVEFIMPDDNVALTSVPVILLSVLKIAIVPALVEEFAIRGVVMQSLRKYGDTFAILMSAFVFALMHGNMVQIPFAFIAGIAIGYAVTVTGSLWTGVLIHFANNFTSLLLQIIQDNAGEQLQNILGGVLILAIFVAGIICAAIYWIRFRKVPFSKGESKLTTGEKSKAYLWNFAMVLAILYLIVETSQYIRFK